MLEKISPEHDPERLSLEHGSGTRYRYAFPPRAVNVTAVTTRAAVDNDDFVVRTVLGTLTVESDCYCHINYK